MEISLSIAIFRVSDNRFDIRFIGSNINAWWVMSRSAPICAASLRTKSVGSSATAIFFISLPLSSTSPILPLSKSSASEGGAMDSRMDVISFICMVVCWLFHRHYLHDIPILQLVFLPKPHLGASIYCMEETLSDIGMYHEGKVFWRTTLFHNECIRKYCALLICEPVLIFYRINNDQFQKLKNRFIDAFLDTCAAILLQKQANL